MASLDELQKLVKPEKLEALSIKGNYAIERHPDHRAVILSHFENLKELDSVSIGKERPQIRLGQKLSRVFVSFVYALDKLMADLESAPQLAENFQVFLSLKDF